VLPDQRAIAEAQGLPVLPGRKVSRVCPGLPAEPLGVVPVALVLPDLPDLPGQPGLPDQGVIPVLPVPQSLLKLSRVLWERYLPGCQVSYRTHPGIYGT